MKSRNRVPFLIGFILFFTHTFAYETTERHTLGATDFTTRVGFDVKRKLYKNFSLTWFEECRFKSFSSRFDRLYSMLSFNYAVNKYFKTAIGYTYILVYNEDSSLGHRHRLHVDLIGTYAVGRWNFSLRERPELSIRMGAFDALTLANPSWDLRSRLSVEYAARRAPLKPYLAFELFNTLNAPKLAKGNYINRVRSEVGLKWRVAKAHSIKFYYFFDVENTRNITIDYNDAGNEINSVLLDYIRRYKHILGIAYTFDWK